MTDRGFEYLDFYQYSLKLLKAAYRLADTLPDYERYQYIREQEIRDWRLAISD
jgi:hypothetical protein